MPVTRKGTAKNSKSADKKNGIKLEFLKPSHLEHATGRVSIAAPIRLYTGGKFGDQLIMRVHVEQDGGGDEEYDWSVKIGGKAFIALEKALGKDLTRWIDGKTVNVSINSYEGNEYIEVDE